MPISPISVRHLMGCPPPELPQQLDVGIRCGNRPAPQPAACLQRLNAGLLPTSQFPGSKHLYGIPERATDLALRPTWGPEGALTGGWLQQLPTGRPVGRECASARLPRGPQPQPAAACCTRVH